MARNNYSYKKYQKELAKKKKQEEKRQSKLDKKNIQDKAQSVLSDDNSVVSMAPAEQASNDNVTIVEKNA